MTMTSLTPRRGVDIYIRFTDLQVGLDRMPMLTMLSLQPYGVAVPTSRIQ